MLVRICGSILHHLSGAKWNVQPPSGIHEARGEQAVGTSAVVGFGGVGFVDSMGGVRRSGNQSTESAANGVTVADPGESAAEAAKFAAFSASRNGPSALTAVVSALTSRRASAPLHFFQKPAPIAVSRAELSENVTVRQEGPQAPRRRQRKRQPAHSTRRIPGIRYRIRIRNMLQNQRLPAESDQTEEEAQEIQSSLRDVSSWGLNEV